MSAETWCKKLLENSDIIINGDHPSDPQIHDPQFYSKIKWGGTLALGETYMDGLWDCDQIDVLFYKAVKAGLEDKLARSIPAYVGVAKGILTNQQSRWRAFKVGEHHYDLGNDLFEAMLGQSMAYSCGYFKDTINLDQAQFKKFELICQKLKLKPGMTVLDIGCGWGGLAHYMASHYDVKVIGLTISKEQAAYAKTVFAHPNVEILLEDYRSFSGTVDRVVSVGMWEHVGPKNYRTAMEVVKNCLNEDGLFVLHTIGSPTTVRVIEPWINKYIFPGGVVPSIKQLGKSAEGLFIIEDVHNFGADYDKTLMAWYANFEAAWPNLQEHYSDRFYRMWRLYLLSCAGGFRARAIQLYQLVLSPNGVEGVYQSVR